MTLGEFKKLDSKAVNYENITDYIEQVFPEFVQWDQYEYYEDEKDLKYIYLAGLSTLAFEGMDERGDIGLAARLVDFTNHVINKFGESKSKEKSDDLHNLFGIEVFENLAGYVKGAALAKQYLDGEALESFHGTTQHYHSDEFLQEYFKLFDMNPIFAKDPQSLYDHMRIILRRPNMNSPEEDELLWSVRAKLEIDEGMLTEILSYLVSRKKPSEDQIKTFYGLQKDLRDCRRQLKDHMPSEKNKHYLKDLLSFIDDLERIDSNTSIWMWNHGIK